MTLPTEYQSFEECTYYVYFHVHPQTTLIMYVGKGRGDRAWVVRKKESGGRSVQHYNWLLDQINSGYNMNLITQITDSGLSEKEAFTLETELINLHRPAFNQNMGESLLILGDEQLELISLMREDGLSYANIASELGVSTMTIYRAYNGQTKGYQL